MYYSLKDKKETFLLHVSKPIQPIKVQVNTTILTWCLDIRSDKCDHILSCMSNESREQLMNGKQGIVAVGVSNQNKPIGRDTCTCIMQENNTLRINLPQTIRLVLQEIFPVSKAIAICKNKRDKFPIDLESKLSEFLEIIPMESENPEQCGFILNAIQKCESKQLKEVSSDLGLLAELVETFMASGAFAITPQAGKGSQKDKDNDNTIVSSSKWKPATEYGIAEAALTNCIYYLSNDDNGNIKKVYVGEAVRMGNRVISKKINGITYIGHKEDIELNKFTRYRIDRLKPNTDRATLHAAQDAIIGGLTMMDVHEFSNGFELTNLAYNRAFNIAKRQRRQKHNKGESSLLK